MNIVTATRGGANELEAIQERYMNCLKTYVEYTAPNQPSRFHELLLCLPEVRKLYLHSTVV